MKQVPTLFLKTAVSLLAAGVVTLCVIALPTALFAEDAVGYRPILGGMYAVAIPFLIALYHAFALLIQVDKNTAFSDESVKSLSAIKYCAAFVSAVCALGLPYVYIVGDKDDAPGVILLAIILLFTATVIATFMAVLEKLIRSAVDLQAENNLTV